MFYQEGKGDAPITRIKIADSGSGIGTTTSEDQRSAYAE